MSGIVVGVDGSEHSRRALVWAMREAVQHHVPLTVITVHPHPVRPATRIYWAEPDLPDADSDPEFTRKKVQDLVAEVASEIGGPAPDVTVEVMTGDPAEELARASRDADLLVVGGHHHGFAALLAGSVSGKVTHRAACPVVVVPGAQPALETLGDTATHQPIRPVT
jgi:nucleotide-binding universal stress UspA family protein